MNSVFHNSILKNGEGGIPVFIPIIFVLLALSSTYFDLIKDYSDEL